MFHHRRIHAKPIAFMLFSISLSRSLLGADALVYRSNRLSLFSNRFSSISDRISGGFDTLSKGFTGYLSKSKMKWNSLMPKTKFGIKLSAVVAGTIGLGAAATCFYNRRQAATLASTPAETVPILPGLASGQHQEAARERNVEEDRARRLATFDSHVEDLYKLPNIDEHVIKTLGSVRNFIRKDQLDVARELVHTLSVPLSAQLSQEDVSSGCLPASSSSAVPATSDGHPTTLAGQFIEELEQIVTQLQGFQQGVEEQARIAVIRHIEQIANFARGVLGALHNRIAAERTLQRAGHNRLEAERTLRIAAQQATCITLLELEQIMSRQNFSNVIRNNVNASMLAHNFARMAYEYVREAYAYAEHARQIAAECKKLHVEQENDLAQLSDRYNDIIRALLVGDGYAYHHFGKCRAGTY